jgi:hypothetical protein
MKHTVNFPNWYQYHDCHHVYKRNVVLEKLYAVIKLKQDYRKEANTTTNH